MESVSLQRLAKYKYEIEYLLLARKIRGDFKWEKSCYGNAGKESK